MTNGTEDEARVLLNKFLDQAGTILDNYNIILKPNLNREVSLSIGARLQQNNKHALDMVKEQRRFVDSVLAAELFPDRNPPEILIAESEEETHETLRERYSQTHPAREPRISGDVVDFKGIKFFKLDLATSSKLLFIKTGFDEIVEILLERGYIPVDTLFELIPPKR